MPCGKNIEKGDRLEATKKIIKALAEAIWFLVQRKYMERHLRLQPNTILQFTTRCFWLVRKLKAAN